LNRHEKAIKDDQKVNLARSRGLYARVQAPSSNFSGWQVADPTRLRHDLAAKSLLVVEDVARLLGERILRASGQQEQEHGGTAFHLRFPPDSVFIFG